jgi:hypothetical protein
MKFGQIILSAMLGLAAALVQAEVVDVVDNHNGNVAAYDVRWAARGRQGVNVRIVGPCRSACTELLGHIGRDRICVTPQASFGFPDVHPIQATEALWKAYPDDIKMWIYEHSTIAVDLVWLRAPDVYRFFHKCRGIRPALIARVDRARPTARRYSSGSVVKNKG